MKHITLIIFIFLISSVFIFADEIDLNNKDNKIDTAEVNAAISNSFFVKLATMFGFGGICGFVTGFALKKIARIFAVILGLIFIVIQLFVFQGWISVDWNAIANSTNLFTGEGLSSFGSKLINILTTNLPFGSSFIVGLFMGFKKR